MTISELVSSRKERLSIILDSWREQPYPNVKYLVLPPVTSPNDISRLRRGHILLSLHDISVKLHTFSLLETDVDFHGARKIASFERT